MEYYSSLDARELDAESPTLFEIISSNQLDQLLSPSLRFILVYYAQKYPRYLLKLTTRFDEWNLLIRSWIEYRQLKNWNASFTEKFYGLKRVQQTPIVLSKSAMVSPSMIEDRRRLSRAQIALSVFEILGVSYIAEKLNYEYEKLISKHRFSQLKPTDYKNKLKILFLNLYPGTSALLKVLNIVLQILYLSGRVRSPSIITYLFNIKYARLNSYDYDLDEKRSSAANASQNVARIRPPSNLEQLLDISSKITTPLKNMTKAITGTAFPVAIFLLKFLEWWNSSEFAATLSKRQRNVLELDINPPDENTKSTPEYKSTDKCPLCKETIDNPATIETGYVFCYKCIYTYLRNHDLNKGGRCPITGTRLLGCIYNEKEGEWELNGIRRLMF